MKVAIIFTLILIGNIFSIIPTFNFANSVTELSSSLTITVDDRKGWYYSSSVLKKTLSKDGDKVSMSKKYQQYQGH